MFKNMVICKNMVSKGLCNESRHVYDMGLCPVKSLTNFLSCADPEYFSGGVRLQTRVRMGPASDQRGSDNVA